MKKEKRALTETEKQIDIYQKVGRPKEIRNLIALSCESLINWGLNDTGFAKDTRRDYKEMQQEAFIILLKAIDSYDSDKGSFSSYFRLNLLNLDRKNEAYNEDISLNIPVFDETEDIELIDIIESEQAQNDFDSVDKEIENENIRKEVIHTLGEDIAKIIFYKYGIRCNEKTYKELSEKYNVSRSKIAYIINNAKYKLGKNRRLQNIWNEYEEINIMNTGSIVSFSSSKTNKVSSVVESAVIKKLSIDSKMLKILDDEVIKIISSSKKVEK